MSSYPFISLWAARVHPGSPCSPSPRRTSPSFINFIDSPSPSIKDFTPDLLSLGYTAVFVPLPVLTPNPVVPHSPTTNKSRQIKRIRSLSVLKPLRLRPRSKSTTNMPLPPHPRTTADVVAKRNKAKYPYLRPAPLANELELMQFMDGGRIDSHVKRVMEKQARAAAPTYSSKNASVPVGDVFRDGSGGIWWDQEEEWEYAHLLGNDNDIDHHHDRRGWVKFADKENSPPLQETDRRGSVSTQDSELDPRLVIVKPSSEDDLAAYGGTLPPMILRNPVSSVLVRPGSGRPRRATVTAGATTTRRPLSPKSTTGRFPAFTGAGPFALPKRGKPRRRPAPLKLAPLGYTWKKPTNSPVDAERVRKDFLEGSFAPAPVAVPVPATLQAVPLVSSMRSRKKSLVTSRQATVLPSSSEATVVMRNAKKSTNVWGLFRVGGQKA